MSAMLTLEEGAVVNNDLAILRNYYRLGVRMITLTWNHPNGIGYPNLISTKEFKDLYHLNTEDGLTDFGIALCQGNGAVGNHYRCFTFE